MYKLINVVLALLVLMLACMLPYAAIYDAAVVGTYNCVPFCMICIITFHVIFACIIEDCVIGGV